MTVKELLAGVSLISVLIGSWVSLIAWVDNRYVGRDEFERHQISFESTVSELGLSFRISECNAMIQLIEYRLTGDLDEYERSALRAQLTQLKSLKQRLQSVIDRHH